MPEIEIELDCDVEPARNASGPDRRVPNRNAGAIGGTSSIRAVSLQWEQEQLANALSQRTDIDAIAWELFERLEQVSEERLVAQPISVFFRLARELLARRETKAAHEYSSCDMDGLIEQLPERSRRVLALDREGLDHRQIAAQLGMTPEAVKDTLVSVYVVLRMGSQR